MAEKTSDLVRLCGLWENPTRNGDTFLGGNLGAARLILFRNTHKEKDSDPDWIAYLSPGKRREDNGGGGERGGGSGPGPGSSSPPAGGGGAPPGDDGIPF